MLRLLAGLRPVGGTLLLAALLGALALGSSVGLLAASAWLISAAALHPPLAALGLSIAAVRFFGVGRGLFRYAERLAGHSAAFAALTELRVAVYDRLARLAPAGVYDVRRGDLLARIVTDVEATVDLPVRVLLPGAAALLVGVGSVVYVGWLLPSAAGVLALALLAGAVLVPWLSTVLGARSARRLAPASGELSERVVALLDGAADLVATGAHRSAVESVLASDAQLTTLARRQARTAGVGAGLGIAVQGAAIIGSLLVAVPAVRDGSLPGVDLAIVVLLPLAAYEAVAALPAAAVALIRVRAAAARVFAVVDTPVPVPDPVPAATLPTDAAPIVAVRGLRVRWAPDGPWVVDGIDLDLRPGRTVALVGPSGAGKSTVGAALLRFAPYDGSITLAGVELARLTGTEVRRRVGLLSQDAHVFDTTVGRNVAIGRPAASPGELRAALGAARLLEWVDDLPAGLDTPVGEHGAALSGGQRQRLAMARLLLAGHPVLVLDEPSEHLDQATGAALLADVRALTADRAVLLITHDLAGLPEVDEIVLLAAGRVLERGSHAELLAAGGSYAAMWARARAVAPDAGADGASPTPVQP